MRAYTVYARTADVDSAEEKGVLQTAGLAASAVADGWICCLETGQCSSTGHSG